MKTKILLLASFAVSIIFIFTVLGLRFLKNPKKNLGNLFVSENANRAALAYSTSSVGDQAVLLLEAATSSRTFARICGITMFGRVFLYKQATSTGVQPLKGTPIFASSSTAWPTLDACLTLDEKDPYLGQVWSIDEASTATSTVSVESKQE